VFFTENILLKLMK